MHEPCALRVFAVVVVGALVEQGERGLELPGVVGREVGDHRGHLAGVDRAEDVRRWRALAARDRGADRAGGLRIQGVRWCRRGARGHSRRGARAR
jgi:hypothetical protein